MSKTSEQLAQEYAEDWHKDCDYPPELLRHTKKATETVFLAGYEACRNHIHLHWKEEWKDLYRRIEESCLPAMDAMEGRYLHQVKELETRIAELETELENWQHNAVHGDEGL